MRRILHPNMVKNTLTASLQRGKPFINECPGPKVVVPVRVPNMGQMKLFNFMQGVIINNLKPYSKVQVIHIR